MQRLNYKLVAEYIILSSLFQSYKHESADIRYRVVMAARDKLSKGNIHDMWNDVLVGLV